MFEITKEGIDTESARLRLCNARAGAYVAFEGWVRNHHEGRDVLFLEYEAYEALCRSEAEQIRREGLSDYDVLDIHCIHRTGKCEIGDMAVWVGVIAEHREAAFEACQYYMNQLKIRVPVWKKETYVTGESEWVRCEACASHHHA